MKMGLFKSKAEKELDHIIQRIDVNMSNNYKDAAQVGLKEFELAMDKLKELDNMKPQVLSKYEEILSKYQKKMKGYTHKDQKPFWH